MVVFVAELKKELKKIGYNIENFEFPDSQFGDIAIPCFTL